MKLTKKEVFLGFIVPVALLIVDKLIGEVKKETMTQTLLSIAPYLIILFSIAYFANVVIKRQNDGFGVIKTKIQAIQELMEIQSGIVNDQTEANGRRINKNFTFVFEQLGLILKKKFERGDIEEEAANTAILNKHSDARQLKLIKTITDW